jgi:acetyl esterase/lipase
MQVYLSALLSIVPFVKPRDRSAVTLLWLPKLMAGAFSPILGLVGGLGAVLGLARRDWKLAGAGFVGAGLVARYLGDIAAAKGQFEAAFEPDGPARPPDSVPFRRWSLPAGAPGEVRFQRDVVYGQSSIDGGALLADLWQPPSGAPRSGLGVIYVHGGAWRIGDKHMGTRTFFRRLAGQGHVILDISYTLWPEAGIPVMVSEVKQAIRWLKENALAHGVDPERVVLMGGSAGAHLALLAAYTPDHPAFQPAPDAGDTSVRGVVAFYPPVDFVTMPPPGGQDAASAPGLLDRAAGAMIRGLFMLQAEEVEAKVGREVDPDDFLAALLGGRADEIPETYRLLSPIYHVGDHCPPTLLLHGRDDVFGLTPGVRRLYQALQGTRTPAILVEFPHTEHAFDLVLPQLSPVARAATQDVMRFLARLANGSLKH